MIFFSWFELSCTGGSAERDQTPPSPPSPYNYTGISNPSTPQPEPSRKPPPASGDSASKSNPTQGEGIKFSKVSQALTAKCGDCHQSRGDGAGKWEIGNYSKIRKLVNTSLVGAPGSVLMRAGMGEEHSAGRKWDKGDQEYQTVLQWIQEGAKEQ